MRRRPNKAAAPATSPRSMVEVMQDDRDTGGRPSIQISSLRCLFGNVGKGYKYCHCIPSFVSHLSMVETKNDTGNDA